MNELSQLLTTDGISGLIALTLMEIMLGIDNVIFVSIILGKLSSVKEKKKAASTWMIIGMAMRIVLLYVLGSLLNGEKEILRLWEHSVSLKDMIMVGGGLFLIVNTTLEIHNKLEGEDPNEAIQNKKSWSSFSAIIRQIILVDFIFSVDGL